MFYKFFLLIYGRKLTHFAGLGAVFYDSILPILVPVWWIETAALQKVYRKEVGRQSWHSSMVLVCKVESSSVPRLRLTSSSRRVAKICSN